MKSKFAYTLAALALASGAAWADNANTPNPYAVNGFDTPQDASWGGWTRGTEGTLYAEWDAFIDASYGAANDGTAVADVGYSGTTNTPNISWNTAAGAWVVSPFNNVVNFNNPGLILNTVLEGAVATTGSVRAVLQIEQWNVGSLLFNTMTLNGVAPTGWANTYDAMVTRPVGSVQDRMWYVYWDLPTAAADGKYSFSITTAPWTAIAQVSLDIGAVPTAAVPEPQTYAMLMMGMGLVVWRARRKQADRA